MKNQERIEIQKSGRPIIMLPLFSLWRLQIFKLEIDSDVYRSTTNYHK